jgi:hypothetical protein
MSATHGRSVFYCVLNAFVACRVYEGMSMSSRRKRSISLRRRLTWSILPSVVLQYQAVRLEAICRFARNMNFESGSDSQNVKNINL